MARSISYHLIKIRFITDDLRTFTNNDPNISAILPELGPGITCLAEQAGKKHRQKEHGNIGNIEKQLEKEPADAELFADADKIGEHYL